MTELGCNSQAKVVVASFDAQRLMFSICMTGVTAPQDFNKTLRVTRASWLQRAALASTFTSDHPVGSRQFYNVVLMRTHLFVCTTVGRE